MNASEVAATAPNRMQLLKEMLSAGEIVLRSLPPLRAESPSAHPAIEAIDSLYAEMDPNSGDAIWKHFDDVGTLARWASESKSAPMDDVRSGLEAALSAGNTYFDRQSDA